MQIKISPASVVTESDVTKVLIPLQIVGRESLLWFSFPSDYEQFLTVSVSDSIIVGLLLYAMERGYTIVSDIPVSYDLLLKLNKYLMPFLCKINTNLKPIRIEAKSSVEQFSGKHVGTGISCGVDSLSTIIYHGIDEQVAESRVDTLALFNTGYYGHEDNNSDRYKEYLSQSISFANKHGFKFFSLDSNISNITQYDFLSAHTYLTCSTLFLFQNYFRTYYYASGYPVFDFKAEFSDPAYYDVFLLSCISTRSLEILSSCSTMTRVERTALIRTKPEILESLYVCLSGNPGINCCKCEKCVRTMLALEATGGLDNLRFSYDREIYLKYRIRYYAYMLRHRKNNIFYKEIYDALKLSNVPIPLASWFCFIPCSFEVRNWINSFSKTSVGTWLRHVYKTIRHK
ncbi:hypothetical protein [Parabacteroides gordonii]|uniref:hypothetical protein n=1 Tax=Parabacteroides gordonii TaxID=574930 RepID=UPI0026F2162B|nr:hypothetical protein [Parabacteroides gordonii]